MGGTCGTHGEGERCLRGFGWEARRKRPLGRPRCRWEDNIKMDLREIGIDEANCIRLAQDRDQRRAFVIKVMNCRVKKWVERCKKCIVCQEKYFEKETVTAPP
jgi:hypothetical protein